MSLSQLEYKTIACPAAEIDLNQALEQAVAEGWLLHSVVPVQHDRTTDVYHVVLYRSAPSQHKAGFPVGRNEK